MPDDPSSSQQAADVQPDDMMLQDPQSADQAAAAPAQSPAQAADPEAAAAEPSATDLDEDIRAAQEALARAGIALETAGIMLEQAASDEQLQEAEQQLAQARIAVIVAGQDLLDLEDIYDAREPAVEAAREALNKANVAIVIATESIFSSRISLPDFDQQEAAGGNGGNSELDEELNESIAIFEAKILDARNEVIGSAPPPTASDEIPGVAVLGGSSTEEPGDVFDANEPPEFGEEVIQQGRMPEGSEVAAVDGEPPALVPDDIPDPQGDDIVAQQLREAATAEKDPVLRDKLWEEYKRYKAGL